MPRPPTVTSAETCEVPATPLAAPGAAQESVPARTSARQLSSWLVHAGAVRGALGTPSRHAAASGSSEMNTIARAGGMTRVTTRLATRLDPDIAVLQPSKSNAPAGGHSRS